MKAYILGGFLFITVTACSPSQSPESMSTDASDEQQYEAELLEKSELIAKEREHNLQKNAQVERNQAEELLLQQAKEASDKAEQQLLEDAEQKKEKEDILLNEPSAKTDEVGSPST